MTAPTPPSVEANLAGVEWCERQGIDYVRLQGVLDWVTAHPERHDQQIWARRSECGTAACLAGWTLLLAGVELDWVDGRAFHAAEGVAINVLATALLGLSSADAADLFCPINTLDDLWWRAARITRGAVRRHSPAS